MRRDAWVWVLAFGFLTGCAAATSTPAETPTPEPPTATPPPASVTIKKYPGNFTCFRIVTSRGVIIVTDPFGMNEDVPADIVTVSHEHSDHNDLHHILPPVDPFRYPGEYEIKGVRITGVAGHHNKGDKTTTNVIFIFDMDGIRLAEFASQGEVPSAEMYAAIGRVDILIIQVFADGLDKLTAGEAEGVIRTLDAKIVIPAHGDITQTEVLASALNAPNERIRAGYMTLTAAELAAQEGRRVVTLYNPGWST
jgi:L-ascorbate metabolism protein UlaG (beta-lactamase superfamily)